MAEINIQPKQKNSSGTYDDVNFATKSNLVSYDNTTSGLSATNTQNAVDELINSFSTNISAINSSIGTINSNINTINSDIDTLQTTAWQDLGTVNITTNTLKIDITVPTGINEVNIIGHLKHSSSSYLGITMNNLTTNYSYAVSKLIGTYTGTISSDATKIPCSYTDSYAYDCSANIHISGLLSATNYKSVTSNYISFSNGYFSGIVNGTLYASNTTITTVSVVPNGGYIASGTNFRVLGR